jgi:hypothetical protein
LTIPQPSLFKPGNVFEHVNDEEVEMALSIIENNIHRLPNGKYPTLGIAKLSISPKETI